MRTPYKFGAVDPNGIDTEHQYSNTWAEEQTSGPARLVIAPADEQVALLLSLASPLQEPFGLLYVLIVPRTGAEPGRYQAAVPVSRLELGEILLRFSRFFQQDGRHNLWILSLADQSSLIYDRHNVVYAYGKLEAYVAILEERGCTESDAVRFPDPHSHHYNAEFDGDESSLLTSREWLHTALRPGDENPV